MTTRLTNVEGDRMSEPAVTNDGNVCVSDAESSLKAQLFEIAGGIWNHLLGNAVEQLRQEMAFERQVMAKERATLGKLVAANARAVDWQVKSPSLLSLARHIGRASERLALAERELAGAMSELSARRQVVERLQSELSDYEARLARALRQGSSGK
jgi:chromosome segregation ATPase